MQSLEEKIDKIKRKFSKEDEEVLNEVAEFDTSNDIKEKKGIKKIPGASINEAVEEAKKHKEDNGIPDLDNDFFMSMFDKLFNSPQFNFFKETLEKMGIDLNKKNEGKIPSQSTTVPSKEIIEEANKMESVSQDGETIPNNASRAVEQQEKEIELQKLDEINARMAEQTLKEHGEVNENSLGTTDVQKQSSIDSLETLN